MSIKLKERINRSKLLIPLIIFFGFSLTVVITSSRFRNDYAEASLIQNDFGKTSSGKEVYIFTLTNNNGIKASITNYGAILVSLFTPDNNGNFNDVVLGYDKLEDYIKDKNYFGAIIGRYAQNISNAEIIIDSVKYKLTANNNQNTIHGGEIGFNKRIWEFEKIKSTDGVGLKLFYISKDGEEGFPGNVTISVTYNLTNRDELKINYLAETDMPTVVNFTHHSYFNLAGQGSGSIFEHHLKIIADKITEEGEGMIPTGRIIKVDDTPMDFRKSKPIGQDIEAEYYQLKLGNGYDHNYVLNNYDGTLRKVADLYEKKTGRFMEAFTTEPGLQLYLGNYLSGEQGKENKVYQKYSAVCLEAQHFPDSPNNANFPSTILRPKEKYTQTTIYSFSVK